jgi:hypothetical protein
MSMTMTAPTPDHLPETEPASAATLLPPPPREISARVRSRSWADPHVRFWWIVSIVLLALGAYLWVRGVVAWRRTKWLVEHGQPVVAIIRQANNEVIPRKQPGDSNVLLDYEWAGRPYQVWGILDGRRPEDLLSVRDQVTIRLDPNDPETWTARTVPPPLTDELVGGGIVLVLSGLVFLPALLARGRVLRTWRDGAEVEATVVEQHQTALAPGARAVRCSAPDAPGGRVFTVFVPGRAVDDTAVRVLLPTRGGRPLAVGWFEPVARN